MSDSSLITHHSSLSPERVAAIRHAVYEDLIMRLPIASYDQACRFVANLRLVNAECGIMNDEFVRRQNAALMLFIGLRVTPDIGETNTGHGTQRDIEAFLNAKYGERLAVVPGFVPRIHHSSFIIHHFTGLAVHAYGNHYGPSRLSPRHTQGLLLQPLRELNRFFLLSSARYGGPKATPLCPADRQFFTQYEECSI